MNTDFSPWYVPVTCSSPYSSPFHNHSFYHPPEYTPPHVFHSPQPPPYFTPPTHYTSPYLPDTSRTPWFSTYQYEIQTQTNPYSPPLSCFMSQPITTTQIPAGFIFGPQSELLAPQVFDESPNSGMPIFNAVDDTCHKMEDKYAEMIQILEKMGKSLAESSKILEGISSKPVSQLSHKINLVSNIDNLDTSGLVKETSDVESEDSNDLQLPQVDISVLHMFDESLEKESSDSNFEGSYDESEGLRQIVDFSMENVDTTGRNGSNGGMLAVNSVVVVTDIGFENKEEKGAEEIEDDMNVGRKDGSNKIVNYDIMLKDIEEWRTLKSELSLDLSSFDVERALDEGGGTGGKVSEICSLEKEVKDGLMKKSGEEIACEGSEKVGDQSFAGSKKLVLPNSELDHKHHMFEISDVREAIKFPPNVKMLKDTKDNKMLTFDSPFVSSSIKVKRAPNANNEDISKGQSGKHTETLIEIEYESAGERNLFHFTRYAPQEVVIGSLHSRVDLMLVEFSSTHDIYAKICDTGMKNKGTCILLCTFFPNLSTFFLKLSFNNNSHKTVTNVYGLDDLSSIVSDKILIIFDPGGYKRNGACIVNMLKVMNRSTKVGLDGVTKVISACSIADVREDMGPEVKNCRERFENFKGMSKQSNSKNFMYAVEAALDQVGRVVKLEMICSCAVEINGKLDATMASNSGFEVTLLVHVGVGKSVIAQYELDKLSDNLKNHGGRVFMKNMLMGLLSTRTETSQTEPPIVTRNNTGKSATHPSMLIVKIEVEYITKNVNSFKCKMQQKDEPDSIKRMSEYTFQLIKNRKNGQGIPNTKSNTHASQRYTKLYTLKHVFLVEIQECEQSAFERMHNVSTLSQKPGDAFDEMQKSGTHIYNITAISQSHNLQFNFKEIALLYSKKCFVSDAERKAEVKRIDVYGLQIIGRMRWEVVSNIFYLSFELDSPDWTLGYVIVHAQSVEVVQILKAKYRVSRQGSAKMDKDFLNRKELCKSISFDRVIAYHDVFQITISSDEANKVQELILLDVTSLSPGIGMRSEAIVFILINTTLPTKKKQVLPTDCDDQPLIMVHVYKCERTRIISQLLGMSELSGSRFIAKRIALHWYWCVTILVFDPGTLVARKCLQIGFILEDKDDFKRGYLS